MPYPTSVRLPEDIRRVLRKEAKANRRTVTEQINYVLQEWVKVLVPAEGRAKPKPADPSVAEQCGELPGE
jgi:hypothetical protein